MKALRIHGDYDMQMDHLPRPSCSPGKVLVRSLYCGVCGSDPPRVFDGDRGFEPEAIGHEFSAVVEEVGEGVEGFAKGDLVVVAPLEVCHTCPDCLNGFFGQCKNSKFIGGSFTDKGGFVEYNLIDPINLVKLPEGIDPLEAAFVEPLSVALHGLFLMKLREGQDLAIVGAGTIGLLALEGAKALGAGRVFMFDINPGRLERAKNFGADYVFNTAEEGFLDEFFKLTNGRGVGQIIEAVGAPDTIRLCLKIADTNADIGLIGTMHKDVTLPPELFYSVFSHRQLHMHGVWMSYSENFPGEEWRVGAKLIAEKKVNVQDLIDRVVDIDDAYEAMLDYTVPNKVNGKIMVRMTSDEE